MERKGKEREHNERWEIVLLYIYNYIYKRKEERERMENKNRLCVMEGVGRLSYTRLHTHADDGSTM